MRQTSQRLPRGLVGFLTTAVAGALLTAAGLAWDAALHAADPGLAAREGVFTASNPGHLLAGLGMALAAIGISGAAFVTLRDSSPRIAKNRLVIAGAAMVAVLAAGSIALATTAGPESHSHAAAPTEGEGHVDAAHEGQHSRTADIGSATQEERQQAQNLLDAVIDATAKYREVELARADGYRVDPDRPDAGLFLHSGNPRYHLDGTSPDPARPESLIYSEMPDGQLLLVGALFKRERVDTSADIGGPITQWHYHDNCIDPATREKVAKPMDGACPDGTRMSGGRMEMMHVWFTGSIETAFAERAPIKDMVHYQRELGVSIDLEGLLKAKREQKMMQRGA